MDIRLRRVKSAPNETSPVGSGIFVLLLVLALAAANFARRRFTGAMDRGGRSRAPLDRTAGEVAREFLDASGAGQVRIVEHSAHVSDYYDPARRALFLRPETRDAKTAAAWAIALHEAAHASQTGAMRSALDMRLGNIRATRYVPALSALAVIALGVMKRPPLTIGWRIAAVVWFAVMLFNLLSLPVEFNASRRALAFLEDHLRLDPETAQEFSRLLQDVAWRDTAAFLHSPVYCLFGALPVGGAIRPR